MRGNKTTPKLEEKPTFDPNDNPYNPLFDPPKWFWPSIGGWGIDQLYKNWPHRDTPKKDKKTPEKPAYNQER